MNREIKFRAWYARGNKMFNVDVLAISECSWGCPDFGKHGVSLAYQSHIEVMQYTGLKDKNGKEIYEGDILVSKGLGELSGSKPNNIGHMPKDIPHKVFFHEGAFKFRHNKRSINHHLSGLTIRYFSLEIIGNIYEHSHLLNKEQSVKESDTTNDK